MGRRGPLPKDPDALLGHRAKGARQRAEPALPTAPRIPRARAEWRPRAYQRIGNSVPPLFMRAIAGHLASEVLGG